MTEPAPNSEVLNRLYSELSTKDAEIDALRAENERLREALRPFADCCDQIGDSEDDEEWAKFRLLIKDYRAARAALKDDPQP